MAGEDWGGRCVCVAGEAVVHGAAIVAGGAVGLRLVSGDCDADLRGKCETSVRK